MSPQIRPRSLMIILMFLVGLLLPVGWMAALATATTPPMANQSPSLTPQPTDSPLLIRSSNAPLDVFCDGTRQPNTTFNPVTTSVSGTITVGNFIWFDLDYDGLQDPLEPGVEGIFCGLCITGIAGLPFDTISTDPTGHYLLTMPATVTESYYVVAELPPGYTFTEQDVGNNSEPCDPVDNDFDQTGESDDVILFPGETYLDKDGGIVFETAYCSSPDLAIPDNDPFGVSDTFTITATGTITDLNIYISTTHPWVGDLVYTLTYEATGQSVTIIDRPGIPASSFGCAGSNISAVLDDQFLQSVEDQCADSPSPAINGIFTPNNSLSDFDMLELSGEWTLSVSDHKSKNEGTLVEWCINPTIDNTNLHSGSIPMVAQNTKRNNDYAPKPPRGLSYQIYLPLVYYHEHKACE